MVFTLSQAAVLAAESTNSDGPSAGVSIDPELNGSFAAGSVSVVGAKLNDSDGSGGEITLTVTASLTEGGTVTGSFADVPAGEYYADAVQWAVSNSVTFGTADTTFSPDQDCTRAQIMTFLYRAR